MSKWLRIALAILNTVVINPFIIYISLGGFLIAMMGFWFWGPEPVPPTLFSKAVSLLFLVTIPLSLLGIIAGWIWAIKIEASKTWKVATILPYITFLIAAVLVMVIL